MKSSSADLCKRDRIVLYVVLAHVPFVGLVGAAFGHLAVGLVVAAVAAALCGAAFATVRGTRAFRAGAGIVLMLDSAALIAASGGQTAVHFHVFIVITFLVLYFDWLPIVAATITIALHHAIGNLLFPALVFGDMNAMQNSWIMVVIHAVAVVLEAAAAIYVAVSVRNKTASVAGVAQTIAREQLPKFRSAITALADGDLTYEARFESTPLAIDMSDEIGAVAASFGAMQDEIAASVSAFEQTRLKLGEMVNGITMAASQLSMASAEFTVATGQASNAVETISISSEQVASGARAQTGQLGDAGLALEGLTNSADQIAKGAQEQTTAVRAVVREVRSLDNEIAGVAELGSTLTAAARLANE